MRDVWIRLEEGDKRGPEFRVLLCKLERQRGEDELEITTILDASRAEKRGTQTVVGKQPFRNRLRDRGLPCPSESVEPEDGRRLEILGPLLDFVQHTLPGPLETARPTPVSITCSMRAVTAIQNRHIGFETRRLAFFNLRLKGI